MKRFVSILILTVLALACTQKPAQQPASDDWTREGVVYELNVRQLTPEGTFAAAEAHLPLLKELGVEIVWIMPPYPIGEKGRKGTLGSYYAIRDYCDINPEFGTQADFDHFLATAHEQGFKVVLDWVANHTSPDHPWVTEKPAEWYVRDADGNTIVEYDWTDIAKLNYDCADMRAEMEKCMRFWLDRGIDGFRCDVAYQVPQDFWASVLPKFREEYKRPLYFLAEGEESWLHEAGFTTTYAWKLHHLLNDVAKGTKSAQDIRDYLVEDDLEMGTEGFRLMFTSNHDENSWAGTEFERMGSAAKVMEVLCFTLPKGQPLVYTGQEIGLDRRLEFFEKDPITDWSANAYTDLIKRLVELRHTHPSLAAGEKGAPAVLIPGVPDDVLAFRRSKRGDTIEVYANLSSQLVEFTVRNEKITLLPWGWKILSNNE